MDTDKTVHENTQTKYNSKQTKQNTAKQNYSGLVASYDAQLGNLTGSFYNALMSTQSCCYCESEM